MKILNFGALNLDNVYQVPHFLQAGETMAALSEAVHPGGKGLNQSLALARAGAEVYHAGVVGNGSELLTNLLKENGVPDAFEKGILGDFTRELAARHKDNRLRAWHGLDNFQAGIKFQKTILEKLAKYDKELEEDVLPYCFDYKKLIDELNVKELGGRLKAYL